LYEPFPEASLVKHVSTVGNSLQLLSLFEFSQAYRAVEVFRRVIDGILIKFDRLEEAHIGLCYLFSVG
jgi:hypothetical protein